MEKERLVISRSMRGWCMRVLLFLYDACAVNAAFFLAIVLRFSDTDSFFEFGHKYILMQINFAPWYTASCLLLFLIFRIYGAAWRYAGANDVKKLVFVNLITAAIYVFGTLLVVGRMPISVYILGAGIQFILIGIPRIAPRYILSNYGGLRNTGEDTVIPLMIIGAGENTRIIQGILGKNKNSIIKPVCVVDEYGNRSSSFNGLPIVHGTAEIERAIDKYKIKYGIVADSLLPAELVETTRKICEEKGVELRDFLVGTDFSVNKVRLRSLLDVIDGPVSIAKAGSQVQRFDDVSSALHHVDDNSYVDNVAVIDGILTMHISEGSLITPAGDEEWAKQYRKDMGNDVSFF